MKLLVTAFLIAFTFNDVIYCYTFKSKTSSYIHFEQWDATENGVLKFKFKTFNPYGLLLYSDNSRSSNSVESFIAVKLNHGKVLVTVQLGSEDYKSKKSGTIGNNLDDINWHHVEIHRRGRETKFMVDKEELVLINDGEYKTLELNSGLYFGGISQQLASSLIDQTIKALPSRFIGCIDDIQYKSGAAGKDTDQMTKENSKKIEESGSNQVETSSQSTKIISTKHYVIAAVDVQDGCMNACNNNNVSCSNGGRCINRFITAQCNCIGTGFYGANCKKEADSLQFKGKDYITVSVAGPRKSTSSNDITLRFKTKESDGIILAAWSGNDHLMLELHQTIIRFSMDLGGGYHILEVNNKAFSDGEWHVVELKRVGREMSLLVDKMYSVNATTKGVFSKFDLRDSLYVGGHPKLTMLSQINSKSQKNFIGCIQQIFYNGLDIVYKVLNTRSYRFKIYGAVKKGCSVTKRKTKPPRDTGDSSVSVSGSSNNEQINKKIPTENTQIFEAKKGKSKDSTLSKKSVIWIAAGLIVGFIVLIVTLALIIHNVRHRYSGVFLSSSVKENNNSAKKLLKRPGASFYTPRNKHPMIEPHLV